MRTKPTSITGGSPLPWPKPRVEAAPSCAAVPRPALIRERERVVGVQTPTETVYAEAVIVANGAWSSDLIRPLGLMLPVKPMRGQMLAVRTVPRAR